MVLHIRFLVKIRQNIKKIIGNEYLCKSEYFGLKLHKQSYSDNTCFYTLEDKYGDFRVDYGNENLQELINVLERENEIDKKYIGILPTAEEIGRASCRERV